MIDLQLDFWMQAVSCKTTAMF